MTTKAIDILLVEDNPSDVELVLRALRKKGIGENMMVARDGEEALELLFGSVSSEDNPIDRSPKIVFLDLKLPKVNGLEVLRKVKSDPRTRRIPIVILTSSKEEQDVISSYDYGVNSYVIKPVNYDEFVQSIVETAMYWLLINYSPSLTYH